MTISCSFLFWVSNRSPHLYHFQIYFLLCDSNYSLRPKISGVDLHRLLYKSTSLIPGWREYYKKPIALLVKRKAHQVCKSFHAVFTNFTFHRHCYMQVNITRQFYNSQMELLGSCHVRTKQNQFGLLAQQTLRERSHTLYSIKQDRAQCCSH